MAVIGGNVGNVVAANSASSNKANFFQNVWDAATHPISMFKAAIDVNNNKDALAAMGVQTGDWSSQDWINYGRYGTLPSGEKVSADEYGSNQPDSSLDATGYDQAQWEYEKQLELLAEQRAYNSAEAQKNRDWQERMSNTAYQRAVQDLEAAGLNKWLAVTGGANGASASTPSGSSATSSAGDVSQPNPYLAKAMLQFSQSIIGSILKILK